jgi:hypothetical protein
MNIIKYIKKLIKKQKLLKKYKNDPLTIFQLKKILEQEMFEKHYLNQIYYEIRCYNRLKKL